MAITRRKFLTVVGGSAAGAVVFQACGVPADELLVQAPVEMPEDLVTGLDNWYATMCRQCSTSEGIVVRVMEGRAKKVEGNVDYPINEGSHSVRCEAGLQALYHPDRIRGPLVRVGERGSGQFREISWDDANARLVQQLKNLQDSGRQSSVVFATDPVGGHLGGIVEKFASEYGARHMGYEPMERTTVRRAIKHVFGQDNMPDFDIENANVVLSFGADFLNTWGSPVRYARGYGEFRQGHDRERGDFIHVDSRFSMTSANADQWVYLNPGSEGILALSIAHEIIHEGLADDDAARALTNNGSFDIDAFAPAKVSAAVGLSADDIHALAVRFASHGPSLAIGGGPAGAFTNGFANLVAIYSLNQLVGNVNKPGGVIFNPKSPFEEVPVTAGVSSFAEWHRLAEEMNGGGVQLLMVRDADLWHGLPDATGFKKSSFNVPMIISFSGFMDDMTAMSDLILPQHNYLEDWGTDVPDSGTGYQTVGFQQPVVRPFLEARGEQLGTRSFGDVLLGAAKGLELDLGQSGGSMKEIVRDAAKTLFDENRGSVKAATFEGFWNGLLQRGGWWDSSATEDRVPSPSALVHVPPATFGNGDFYLMPFATTGIGDGRGASLPWMQATPDPITSATWQTWVEINEHKAEDLDIKEGDVIRITSSSGSIEAIAYPHPAVSPNAIAVPVGQGHIAGGRYAKDRGANVYSILDTSSDTDTGALAWAATKVNIVKTGEWLQVPKFENAVTEAPRDEEQLIIKITPIDG
jgi:anaerobic selenocysteine-containing dehydrogenase